MRAALAVLLLLPSPGEPAVEVLFAPTGDARRLQARAAAELGLARTSVRVAMFHFTSERLARALAERARAGVPVRVLLDARQSDAAFVGRLRGAGIEVRLATPRGDEQTRFHHKYSVLDDRIVLSGSYNWTVQGDMSNHENLVLFRDEAAARAFAENFDRTWEDPDLSRP